MTMAMTKYDAEARKAKARVAAEGFADRVYADDGQLVSRKLGKDALVSDPAKAAEQAVRMVMEGKVRDDHRQDHRREGRRPSASTATARARTRSWPRCATGSSRPAPS